MTAEARLERAERLAWLTVFSALPFLFAVAANRIVVALAIVAAIGLGLAFRSGRMFVLPNWALNLVGIGWLAAFFLTRRMFAPSFTGFVVQLLLFLIVVRLASLRGGREEWTALLLVGFLAVAGAATAVDLRIVAWLLAAGYLFIDTIARFVYLEDRAEASGTGEASLPRVPDRRFAARLLVAATVAAIPIFLVLPRTRSPFLRGLPTDASAAGSFADSIDMASIGDLKRGNRIVMRIRFGRSEDESNERAKRFRGLAYANYEGGRWGVAPGSRRGALSDRGYAFPHTPEAAARDPECGPIDVDLVRTGTSSLFIPYDAVALESPFPLTTLFRDRAGLVGLRIPPPRPISYRVWRTSSLPATLPWERPVPSESRLPAEGLPRLRELAGELAPAGLDARAAGRSIETRLATSLSYSLVIPPVPEGTDPIEHFLFESRQGHCELFASAMVLMLRSRGIPARMVVGFSGGERSFFGGEVLLRQRHAHAWVEAWDEKERRWLVFDPTPAVGQPIVEEVSVRGRFRQLWERSQFVWDRYVLGFDFGDQFVLFQSGRRTFRQMARSLSSAGERASELAAQARQILRELDLAGRIGLLSALIAAVLAVRFAAELLRSRRVPPARRAWDGALSMLLARRLLSEEAASRSTAREVAAALAPGRGRSVLERIVDAYEREAFRGERLDEAGRRDLAGALREFRRALRAEG